MYKHPSNSTMDYDIFTARKTCDYFYFPFTCTDPMLCVLAKREQRDLFTLVYLEMQILENF